MINFLSTFLSNPWVLVIGAAALLIPPIIHLLNRRRFDVVEWGAMQFLQVSENVRRRLLIEELLLMLLRIALLAVLVIAIAGPFSDDSSWWPFNRVSKFMAGRASKTPRDVVLVIDGSASMSAHAEGEKSPAELVREFAKDLIDDLSPGDAVAVILARERPVGIVDPLSVDHARAKARLEDLPPPAGSCNFPVAVHVASSLLAHSHKAQREVVILSDNQKFGWADPEVMLRWELLAGEAAGDDKGRPRVWAVNLAKDRPPHLPNWALGEVVSNRPVVPADREVTFRSDIFLFGQKDYKPPHRLRLEVDGKHVKDLPPPDGKGGGLKDGRVPFSFTHRFARPGSHLVSVTLEPDPPADARPAGYEVRDRVPGDNRQDFSVEVLAALPVLIVDGEISEAPQPRRNTDFLRDALSPARDKNPAVKATVVGVRDFTPQMLAVDPKPRVLILHDIARLEVPQLEAITAYLAEGGGVLVTLGARAEADWYNQNLYRGGDGWLPAKLDELAGDEAKPKEGMRPDPTTFTHPALDLFRRDPFDRIDAARFPRYWKLSVPGKSAAGKIAGTMRNGTSRLPFVVERVAGAGRVLLSAVSLDNAFGTNLTGMEMFVPLVHELVCYLAAARSSDYNLSAGQPIRYVAPTDARLADFSLEPPVGGARKLSDVPGERDVYPARLIRRERESLVIFDGTRESGVYRLTTPSGDTVYYNVPPDGRESDLTPCDETDREKVAEVVADSKRVKRPVEVKYVSALDELKTAWVGNGKDGWEDWWWYLLVALLGLLCFEVWMTRRLVMNR